MRNGRYIKAIHSPYYVFKSNHADLGALICKRWRIPEPISAIVAFHHVYKLPSSITKHENILNVIRLVQLADLISELSARTGKANNLKDLSKYLHDIPEIRSWCVEKIKSRKLLRDFKSVLNEAYSESQYSYKQLGIS